MEHVWGGQEPRYVELGDSKVIAAVLEIKK